jgi:hypothetical protein
MKQEEIDTLWYKALDESIKQGELYTRYKFAELIAAAEREECARLVYGIRVNGRTLVVKAIRARGDA